MTASHPPGTSSPWRRRFLAPAFAAAALGLLVGLAGTGCQPRGTESVRPMRADVAALIERHVRSKETGDEAAFLASLHPDVVYAYPEKRLTRDGVTQAFRKWKSDFTDTKIRLSRLVIDRGVFATEYMHSTTVKATGKRTATGAVAVGEVRDGRIVLWKEYSDGRVAQRQQTGELPVDELAEPFPWPDTPESRVP